MLVEGSEGTNPVVNREPVVFQMTPNTRIITTLPDWGLRARIVQEPGSINSTRLEMSVPLREEEGDALLSEFLPVRMESPEWQTGSFENACEF